MRRMLDEKDIIDIAKETIDKYNIKPVSGTSQNDKWTTITIGDETHGFPSGGGGGDAVWGDITGTLADQTDLKNALDAKQDVIADLSDIRSGAAEGATAVQPSDLATVATTGDYDDLTDKPDLSVYAESADLATVATSGDYDDLTNKPTIPAAQVNSDWNSSSGVSEILNKPDLSVYAVAANLASVATSGSYNDLSNKPTIPAAQVNADWSASSGVAQILNKPTLGSASRVDYGTNPGNVPMLVGTGTNGKLPTSVIPDLAITDTFVESTEAGMLALQAEQGDVCIRTDLSKTFILAASPASTLANWKELLTPTGGVSGTNDGTYWTALTIGSSSYALNTVSGGTDGTDWTSLTINGVTRGIAASSAPSNMVTTNTSQSGLSGKKTWTKTWTDSSSNVHTGTIDLNGDDIGADNANCIKLEEQWLTESGGSYLTHDFYARLEQLGLTVRSQLGSSFSVTDYRNGYIFWNPGSTTYSLTLPAETGTIATDANAETWTFEVDDGQGGTTTVTKKVILG